MRPATKRTRTRARRITRMCQKKSTFRSARPWDDPGMRWGLLAGLVLLAAGCGGHGRSADPAPTRTQPTKPVVRHAPPRIRVLVPRPAGALDAAVEDAAAAPFAGGAVLAGGLTSSDASTDAIVTVTRAGSRAAGHLPGALHDAAAATMGNATYVFGGGNGLSQLDAILMVDPRTGAAQQVGKLPAPSSDQAAASIGG